jgi:hypothetical protein
MKKILTLLLVATLVFSVSSCDDLKDDVLQVNFVSFEATDYEFGVDIDGSSSNEIKVYTSKSSGSDRTFNIKVNDASTVDPNAYTFTQVTVPANSKVGTFTVTIEDLNISDLGETLILEIEDQEGLYKGQEITLNIKRICPFDAVSLSFVFDNYPEEVSWELKDNSGTVITTVTAGTYTGLSSFTQELCLPDGDYTITFADTYGDGIGGEGGYALTYKGTELASGGAYGFGETISFSVQN